MNWFVKNVLLLHVAMLCMVATVSEAQFGPAAADWKAGTAVTGKPDVFGNTTTTYKDERGRTVGTAVVGKPDVFGNTATTYKDERGRTVGTVVVGKADAFGNTTRTVKE